ncbi:hypothetical protein QCB49_11080 (plasmid) [Cetobacterium somerae]|uniref:hypothetical protein n=1 Tax=Cetobacterium somerae TaxID=188913 RepID=UPI003892C172
MYAEIKLTKQEYIDITIKKLSNLVLNTDVKAAYIPSGQGKRIATLIKTNEIESNNSIPMLEPVKRERTISFKQDQFQKVYSKLEGSANFNLILTKNGEVRFLNNKTFSNSILLTKGSDYINSGINSFDYSNNLEIFDRDLITASPGTINVLKCNSGDVFLNTNLPRVENKIKLIYHTIGKNIWSTPNDETIIGFEIFAENSLEDFIASITEKGDFFQTIEIPVYDKEKIEIYLDKLTIEVKKIDIPKETINFSGRDLFEQDYSNREFQGMVKDENLIVLKNGETEIFRETLLSLKEEKGKEIPNSGISMSYGSESNKFIFRKEKFVNYNENLKLEIRTSKNTILYTIDIQLINSNLETDTTITFESNNFNMIKGDELSSYGRIRIYPTSNLSYISNIGILDLNDTIVADKNRKNGQFLQATVSGNTYPLREHHFGKSIYVTMDGEKKRFQ